MTVETLVKNLMEKFPQHIIFADYDHIYKTLDGDCNFSIVFRPKNTFQIFTIGLNITYLNFEIITFDTNSYSEKYQTEIINYIENLLKLERL